MITHTVTRTVARGIFANRSKVLPPIRDKLLLTLRPTIFGEDVTLDDLYGNLGEDVVVEWRERYGEDVPIGAYMIPESMQAEMFTILGAGLWFDSVGVAKQVNCIELAQSPEINQWSVWYRLDYAAGLGNREVLFYDPATLTISDYLKISAYFKAPGSSALSDAILYYDADASGYQELTGGASDLNYSILGPQYELQSDGTYVNAGAKPAIDFIDGSKWLRSCGAVTNLFTSEPGVLPELVSIFQLTFPGSQTITGTLRTKSASDYVYVDWGDGVVTSYAGSASDVAWSHTYSSAGNFVVKFFAVDQSVLTRIIISGNTSVTGTLSLPSGMTNFSCDGSNTLSGTLSLHSGMTNFSCAGSNTLSGTLSLPSGMTYFRCTGSNTLSGALSLPSGMTYFICTGSNTLSGTLSLPSGMTYFICTGSNTLSGVTFTTIPTSQQRFTLTGYNTLTSADVDSLIDLYSTKTWTGTEKDFIIQGDAQNRTSASDAGYALLQAAGLRTLSVD